MKSFKTLLIAGAILILACSTIYALNYNVTFTSILKIQNSGYCQTRDWVITNQTDFCNFWSQAYVTMDEPPPCPNIDFSTYVIIVTAMGRKTNSCYNMEIYCIENNGGNYTVGVKDNYPQKGWFCPMMMVCPVHAVQAPKPTGTVAFRHTQ